MAKTLFKMLDEIYEEIDKPFYDELTDYEKGVKDILNMLDVRMTGNDEQEIYDYIIKTIKSNHYNNQVVNNLKESCEELVTNIDNGDFDLKSEYINKVINSLRTNIDILF